MRGAVLCGMFAFALLAQPATAAPDSACRECHPEIFRRADSPFSHAPAQENGCLACHTPHDSSQSGLLKAPYPVAKAGAYDSSRYALCWGCHDSALGSDKFTSTGTGFRHGRRNSHYSHLRRRGVTECRACHDPHGSGQPFLVRKRPPTGEEWWAGTMIFERVPGGGRCLGGCHRDISYER